MIEQVGASPRLPDDDRGATATEYGLLVGFIAMAIVLGVGLFGSALAVYFTALATWIGTAI